MTWRASQSWSASITCGQGWDSVAADSDIGLVLAVLARSLLAELLRVLSSATSSTTDRGERWNGLFGAVPPLGGAETFRRFDQLSLNEMRRDESYCLRASSQLHIDQPYKCSTTDGSSFQI